MPKQRFSRALGAVVVMVAGSVVLLSGRAGAAPCDPGSPAGDCTLTATVTLTAGPLTLAAPASLSLATTLNGTDQNLVDTTAADQQYTVNDATGSGAGWHVTTSATTFTNGTQTLPDSGTFLTNGSTSSVSSTNAPSSTCVGTCTLPTNSITYPVAITTAATSPTPVTIYNAAAASGLGAVVIGGSTAANPVGWWVRIPANAASGSYTSTVTMAIVSGP
ncbi:hypothetical protein GCM10017673_45820 [Streptosporangium violaceochromogenes]|nr:hypothetical protein GCM10017673_45820 [Streptosporangium violaceochromogenes]